MWGMHFYARVHICSTGFKKEKVSGNMRWRFSGELSANDAFH